VPDHSAEQEQPGGWFESVYANAAHGEGQVPWALMRPSPHLIDWLDRQAVDGPGQSALVVGCGLGDDAEELARRGFHVTAFDFSPTAIEQCKQRFPNGTVDYQVADLLGMPSGWKQAFGFVFENRTIQAMPYERHPDAIRAIAATVAPGGRVLVLCHGRDANMPPRESIPWPLSRRELVHFQHSGLREDDFEDFDDNGLRRFRVAYSNPQE
jgi:SAM-dependent methyltransferase